VPTPGFEFVEPKSFIPSGLSSIDLITCHVCSQLKRVLVSDVIVLVLSAIYIARNGERGLQFAR